MIKQLVMYFLLSILVIVFAKYVHWFIVYIDLAYTYINIKIAPVFNYSSLGSMIRQVVVLVLLPILMVTIPAVIYRLVKGKNMPHLIPITWIIWLIILLSKVFIR